MARRKRIHGRILAVWDEPQGGELISDAAAGTTTLYLDDVSAFNDDGDGGWLQVGEQVVEYTDVDDDTQTITLAAPLATAVTLDSEQAEVWSWNDLYDELDSIQMAQVIPDGKRDLADAIEAEVADTIEGLANGDRGKPGESCIVQQDGDEWEVIRVKGRPKKSRDIQWEHDDVYALTAEDIANGSATVALTHKPMDEAVDAKWNGLGQKPSNYTVDDQTVTWTLPAFAKADDLLTFHYTYRTSLRPGLHIRKGHTWKYSAGGSAGETSKAQPGYDDSSWSTGPSGHGYGADTVGVVETSVPPIGNDWLCWLRTTGRSHGRTLQFSVYANMAATVWVDGTQVWSTAVAGWFEFTVDGLAAGVHTFAAFGSDQGWVPSDADAFSALLVEVHEQ